MAERRMFAKTIIDSDAFLDMPLSSQALYFHLNMRADDDGFVNSPKKIQRLIGCTDDDFKLLIAKSFIIPFESGVVVIKHWRINNYIQNDRYKETVYQEEKALLSVKKNSAYTLLPNQETPCIQDGYNLDTQNSIGKVSIGKNSIYTSSETSEADGEEKMPTYQTFIDLYHELCPSFPRVQKLTEGRKTAIKARWTEYPHIDTFKKVFTSCENNSFMKGNNDRNWMANFDFIFQASSFTKIVEGYYDNLGRPTTPEKPKPKNAPLEGKSFDPNDFFKAATNRKYGG